MTSSQNTTDRTTTNPFHAWADALDRNDPDGVAAVFAPDGVLDDIDTGQRAQGYDAIRATATGFLGMCTDLHLVKVWELTEGGRYADEWVMTGVHTGAVPDLPATGRSFRLRGAGAGEMRDGLMVRGTEYWNMADFLAQVGLLPGPPQNWTGHVSAPLGRRTGPTTWSAAIRISACPAGRTA